MKRFFVFWVGLLLCTNARGVPATVNYIFDGDTFSASVHLNEEVNVSVRVRLINVDTPEINGRCPGEIEKAIIAKNRLAELLPIGSLVELINIKDDKYLGRIDAFVFTGDGKDVGEILIKENLGRRYNGGRRIGWCK